MAPRSYATAVQAAGAVALLLPPDAAAPDDPDRVLERIDGLILAGGSDVDPETYGAERHPETKGHLARARPLRARPCPAGARPEDAAAGDLPRHADAQRRPRRHPQPASPGSGRARGPPSHPGELRRPRGTAGALLAGRACAAGAERTAVKSHHHQGVEKVGEGLEVSGQVGRRRDRSRRSSCRARASSSVSSGTRRRTSRASHSRAGRGSGIRLARNPAAPGREAEEAAGSHSGARANSRQT